MGTLAHRSKCGSTEPSSSYEENRAQKDGNFGLAMQREYAKGATTQSEVIAAQFVDLDAQADLAAFQAGLSRQARYSALWALRLEAPQTQNRITP
jgi:hypothetical protein